MSETQNTSTNTWLLAVDGSPGSDHAARYVAAVAKRLGVAEIRLLNARLPGVGSGSAQTKAAIRQEAQAAAERTAASARRILEFAGLTTRLEAPVGDDPASLIAAAGQKAGTSEIILGTRGVSALANLALGSVAYKVLHLARRPVTLVPTPEEGRGAKRPSARGPLSILLAVDGSKPSNRAVDFVCRLAADSRQLDVHLLNVQPRIVSGNVRRFVAQSQIDAYYRDLGTAALRSPIRLLDRAGIAHHEHILTGTPVEMILDMARDSGCDRIVMGTRGLAAAGSLLLGSVTYGVVHRADRAVTLVK